MSVSLAHRGLPAGVTHFNLAELIGRIAKGTCREERLTARDGIMVLSENEKMLNSTRSFLVAATRFTGEATLIVDNARSIERDVARNAGDKTSAMEIARGKSDLPDHSPRFWEDLKKLSAELGPQFARAVLENKERDITLEKPLGGGPKRSRDLGEPTREKERNLERER